MKKEERINLILRTHHDLGRVANRNGNEVETSGSYEVPHEIKQEGNQTRTKNQKCYYVRYSIV